MRGCFRGCWFTRPSFTDPTLSGYDICSEAVKEVENAFAEKNAMRRVNCIDA